MQRTRTIQQTETTTHAARYISTRILGDLLSIHEKFNISTKEELIDLAHDVQIGLAHDCLSDLRLFLYPPGIYEPSRIYVYRRVDVGSFAPSNHSGRIQRSGELDGGRINYEVTLRDVTAWNNLRDRLRISWCPCNGRSIYGTVATTDGGYVSGGLGVSRTMYTVTR